VKVRSNEGERIGGQRRTHGTVGDDDHSDEDNESFSSLD